MSDTIRLIVGLGNPGTQYEHHRHNAGAWLVSMLAEQFQTRFCLEKKFFGKVAQINIKDNPVWLLLPQTYMNQSGRAVRAMVDYLKLSPESILIAHDELDLEPGIIRFKQNGGHAGHNGLKNIIEHMNHDKSFYRLRIGIGHPGRKELVHDYVLQPPSKSDKLIIEQAIDNAALLIPDFIDGDKDKIIHTLHSG